MTPAEMELARELVAHAEWRWAPGMLAVDAAHPAVCIRMHRDADGVVLRGRGRTLTADYTVPESAPRLPPGHEWIPDLSDPATWGGLLAQLPLPLDLVTLGGHASLNVLTGVGTVAVRGPTMGEAVARAWLATRGGGK